MYFDYSGRFFKIDNPLIINQSDTVMCVIIPAMAGQGQYQYDICLYFMLQNHSFHERTNLKHNYSIISMKRCTQNA
jgi:hypothetical protein